ncbi:hypothetical protein GGI07_003624 [Coemansia sp. Benny D115]|nr:hypothetical protein GGI07_003624 [Coemansia sp. Benny D115]
MSVRGVIRPLAKGISMVRAGFQIIERTGRKVLVFGSEQAITQNEIIVDNCVDMPSSQHPHGSNRSNGDFSSNSNNIVDQSGLPLTQEISASRCLSVPEAYTAIQYDIHRGPIRINHELVMFVTILDDTNTLHNLRLSTPMFVLPKLVGKQLNLPRYEETGLDRLVETSGDCKLQRDVDFWSNYVLIDMEDSSSDESDSSTVNSDTRTQAETLADIELADSYAPDYCPLALDGYQQLTTGDAPPPSYPGAARTMERTVH